MLGIPGPADIKRYATIAAQNAVPTEWQYVAEKVQDGMVKKSEKDKEVAKETGKTLKKIDVKKAKDTIVDILEPGVTWWNPFKVLGTAWYMILDFLPGNFGTNKILTDRLETFREPNQNVNFQRDAMEVFRDHLKFLDIAMKRMKDKPAIFKVFPFNMMSKQNAERDKVRAEKTKYLNEVVASLDAHLTFIQENLLGNTISGVSGVYRQGLYQARLLPRDIKDLQRFSEAIKEGGKYERIMHLPAIQAIKQKDDQMLAQLPRNNAVAFNRQRNNAVAFNRPSSSRAQQEALARAT